MARNDIIAPAVRKERPKGALPGSLNERNEKTPS